MFRVRVDRHERQCFLQICVVPRPNVSNHRPPAPSGAHFSTNSYRHERHPSSVADLEHTRIFARREARERWHACHNFASWQTCSFWARNCHRPICVEPRHSVLGLQGRLDEFPKSFECYNIIGLVELLTSQRQTLVHRPATYDLQFCSMTILILFLSRIRKFCWKRSDSFEKRTRFAIPITRESGSAIRLRFSYLFT